MVNIILREDIIINSISISIIIPIYNAADYLSLCLESVFGQDIHEKEVICIDDGSTDSSMEILETYRENSPCFRVEKQIHSGSGPARNLGLSLAKGEYVCFMDADDYYPNASVLNRLYSAAKENDAVVCGGNRAFFQGEEELLFLQKTIFQKEGFLDYFSFQDHIGHCRYIYKKSFLEENEIEYPRYLRFQDPPFLVKTLTLAKKVYSIPEITYMHRVGHKEVPSSYEIAYDYLCGRRDLLHIAAENNLQLLYDNCLKDFLYSNEGGWWEYAYKNEKEIWAIVDEVHLIERTWLGIDKIDIFQIEKFQAFVNECIDNLNRFEHLIDKGNIIVYGNGYRGSKFIKLLLGESADICGVAVSADVISDK